MGRKSFQFATHEGKSEENGKWEEKIMDAIFMKEKIEFLTEKLIKFF